MTIRHPVHSVIRTISMPFMATMLLAAVFFAGLPTPVQANGGYSGGAGTSGDPYRISTITDWTTLRGTTADWTKHFVLTADIDFGGESLTPVGNSTTQFTGSVDGDDHVMSNAIINQPASAYVGVFGYVGADGQISDLGVDGLNVVARTYAGGLVGENHGTVQGCYTTGNVSSIGDSMMGGSRTGGLVGFNYQGTVTDSYATGSVTAGGGDDFLMGESDGIGGLVGSSYQGAITRCYATGAVDGDSFDSWGGWEVGGLVGLVSEGSVTDCYATGTASGSDDVGGLIGYAYSATITRCYATGAVSGSYSFGGLVGGSYLATITASYWNTQTSGQSSSVGGEGRTTDEMTYAYAANTYVDWNFTSTWVADSANNNSGYPYLNWQPFALLPEMDIQGNGSSIGDGDASSSTADHTDFGSVGVSSGTVTRTFTIQNTGSANLTLSGDPKVALSGANAADFAVVAQPSSPVTASGSTTFQVTFDPSATGVRAATVSIASDDADENPYNFSIQGRGTSTLTVSGVTAANKTYDGLLTATLNTGSAALVGVADGDNVTLNVSSASGAFADKNVGMSKTVTVSGLTIEGDDVSSYSLAQPTTTANITQKSLAVRAAGASRVYDGSVSATVTLSDDRVSGDTLTASYAAAVFADRNVGGGKAVSVSGITISGVDAGNYAQNTSTSATANVTARPITVTAASDSKAYDGTNTSSGAPTVTSGSIVSGDNATWTQTFNNKNVGTGKTLTPAGTVNDGNSGNNYSVTLTPVSTGTITQKGLTVSDVTAASRAYDGTVEVVLDTDEAELEELVEGDTVTLNVNSATGVFANKNAGNGKTVTISGIAIGGADAGNYTLTQPAATANITARAITVTAAADNKTYDGTTSSSATPTITSGSLVSGDTVTWTQTYSNKNAGTGKTLTPSGTVDDGNSGNNYSVTLTPVTTGAITTRAITVTAATDTKTYDGTNASSGTPTITSGSLATGDSATWTQTFDNKNVGTGKTLTPSGTVNDGNSGNSYSVTTTPVTTGAITAKGITVTGVTAASRVYNALTTASLNADNATLVGAVTGDNVTLVTDSATGAFGDKTVGSDKAVTVSGMTLDGADKDNYSLTQPSATANVTAKGLTVTGISANNKLYDGTTTATLNTSNATLVGVVVGDTVTLDVTAAEGAFDNANPGTGKTVTVSGLTINGADAANYSLTQPATTADITAPEISVEGNSSAIADGDNITSTADHTDFGLAYAGVTTVTRTFTIRNTGSAGLHLTGDPIVAINGPHAGDFTVTTQPGSVVASGDNVTFQVRFSPLPTGVRTATVSIANDDIDENPYDFCIQGTGVVQYSSSPGVTPTPTPTPTRTPEPTPTPTPAPVTTPAPSPTKLTDNAVELKVNVDGQTGTVKILSSGVVKGSATVTSTDDKITLTIPDGATVLKDGQTPVQITITPHQNPPSPPAGQNIIGIPYECLPGGTTFDPPVILTWRYDPATMPAGTDESSLKVAVYNSASGKWDIVDGVVDITNHAVTVRVSHFSVYALLAPETSTSPAILSEEKGSSNGLVAGIVIAAALMVVIAAVLVIERRRAARSS